MLCFQGVVRLGAWGVGRLGCPIDSTPAEVRRRNGLQTAEGALEGALALGRTWAALPAGHDDVIYGDGALLTPHHSFNDELENREEPHQQRIHLIIAILEITSSLDVHRKQRVEINLLVLEEQSPIKIF